MSTFYLIRHGLIDEIGHSIAGRRPDVHLNATGKRQVEGLAERLAGEPIERLYTSPLERARETAEALAACWKLEPVVAEEIAELDFGQWTGRTFAELDESLQWRLFNTFRSGTRMPGGEWMLQVQMRAVLFLQRLRDEFPQERIAIVSHGDAIRAILVYYLGMPLDFLTRIEVSPASVSILLVDENGPQVLGVNATTRLDGVE